MHLIRIKTMTDRNPALTFISDQYWSIKPDPDDSNSDEKTPEPVRTDPVTYYRHPIKVNMKIDNFATASEVFALMTISGDSRASAWLDLTKQMPDAPNS
jgi:hypothetical protein